MLEPWVSGDVTLYCGDCLDILPTLPAGSVDAVVTDPPYGLSVDYSLYDDTTKNLEKMIPDFISNSIRVAKRVIITCGVLNIRKYPEPTWVMSWYSPNSNSRGPWGFSCWQPILVYGKDPYLVYGKGCRPDSFSYSSLNKSNGINHPCPKPIELMTKIITRCSFDGDLILDPFFGSGTTGVACVQTGRRFIGIEIDPKYFDIARKRIEAAQQQIRMVI